MTEDIRVKDNDGARTGPVANDIGIETMDGFDCSLRLSGVNGALRSLQQRAVHVELV